MRSNNPILSNPNAFSRAQAAPAAGYDQYQGQQWGQPGQQQWAPQQPVPQQSMGLMTIDDVITKSAITMGLLMLVAGAAFVLTPLSLLMPTLILSGLVGFVTVLIVALRRVLNPVAVLAYAVIEGIFIGAFSKVFEMMYPGIVVQAVLGTFVAAGATLAAYKFLRIRVTNQFRRIVVMSTFAFAGVMLVNFVLAMFGVNLGMRTVGGGISMIAVIASLVGVVLAVMNLILDFDFIEQGVRNQAPAVESWRGAFGLTVTMVWLYTELLRILSYLRR